MSFRVPCTVQDVPQGWPTFRPEGGSVVTEAVVIIPVLLLLLMGMVDLGRFFLVHMNVSRVAYEGCRFGAAQPGLPTENNETGVNHLKTKARITQLLQRLNLTASLNRISFSAATHSVRCELELPFRPLFARFVPLARARADVTAPYLFPRN
jgi:hypothetical protein